ncbi:MAG: hypothetical protein AAGC43_04620 [Bacteroidota bacterium]
MKVLFSEVSTNVLDIKPDRRTEVFNYGRDNAYPSLNKTLVENSVTAKSCVDKVAKAIYGKSFGEVGMQPVNKKGQTLNEVLRIAARDFAENDVTYLAVGFDATLKIKSVSVVPVPHVRAGKADDRNYFGKWIVYDNWDKKKSSKIMSSKFKVVDRYNPKEAVVRAQILKVGGIKNYHGQILQITKEPNEIYPLSPLHSVFAEALVEYNSSVFRSNGSKRGFLNNKLMVVKPFASEDDREDFQEKVKELQGSEAAGRVFLLESGAASDDLKSEIFLDDLTSEFDDELFSYSDERSRKNIALAFGVPLPLVDTSESSLFGNSGELIKEMKKMLWESKEEERDMIEEAFKRIMQNWTEEMPEELKIINPYVDATTNSTGASSEEADR